MPGIRGIRPLRIEGHRIPRRRVVRALLNLARDVIAAGDHRAPGMHRENLQCQIARIRLGWLGHRLQEALPKKSARAGRVRRSQRVNRVQRDACLLQRAGDAHDRAEEIPLLLRAHDHVGIIENRPARSQPHQ